ncbi:MAG: hypothetical protein M3322_05795 [Actinomycetota bacterium]|nr:hypothetical protein [Actinomycetota bacterium]
MRKTLWTVLAVSLAALAGLAAVPLAAAKDGDVRVSGRCTKASTVKLKLSEEDGRIEVEFEVDQNRNGVRWNVVLRRNGAVVRRATRVTRPPSGSFEVRALAANRAGADRITATATRRGERCSAGASF